MDEHQSAPETRVYTLENLGCAHCAAKMEEKIRELPGVEGVTYYDKEAE